MQALEYKHLDPADQADDQKKDINNSTKDFRRAIEVNNIDQVQRLIMEGQSVDAFLTRDMETPLHIAVYNGCETICMMLLK